MPEDDPDRLDAWLYDAGEVGWPGEIEFYRSVVAASGKPASVLDVACGTGRIALALASRDIQVTGTDRSVGMIDVARSKTSGANPRWVVSDMRDLTGLGLFSCAIVGGHAFQFMTTEADSVAALRAIGGHLIAGGRVVLHIDNPGQDWLDALPEAPGPLAPAARVRVHPLDGSRWRMASQWRLDRDRADAILTRAWQRLDASDRPIDEVGEEPMRLHVFTVDEVGSAVEGAGLRTLAVFGDFDQSPFTPASSSIVYVVERP